MISIGLRAAFDQTPNAVGLGYDYLELPLCRTCALSSSEFEELLAYLGATHTRVAAVYEMLPDDLRVNGTDVRASRQHEYLDFAFDRASRLGARIVAFDAARSRNIPSGVDFDLARRQTGNFLRIVQGHANAFGLRVAIRNLRHAECTLINTVSEAALMSALLQLSQVGVLADTVQMAYASEPLEAIDRCGSALIHIYTGCALGRTLPHPGDGEDYPRLFRLLARMGYSGGVTAVCEGDWNAEAASAALRHLKAAREEAQVGQGGILF